MDQTLLFHILLYTAGVLGLILLYLWPTYNNLVKMRNQVKTDYSDIDIQLNRKASLVYKLAELVGQYAKHEKDTFTEVTQARSMLNESKTAQQKAQAEDMLSKSLRSLFAVVENYPTLQASENYKQLRQDILETENSIAGHREQYNGSVLKYNNFVETFPSLLGAKLFGFNSASLFQITKEGEIAV